MKRKEKMQKMQKRLNTLELEVETLKNAIKDEMYKAIMKKLAESDEIVWLKQENKKLRKKNKEYKAQLSSLNGKV